MKKEKEKATSIFSYKVEMLVHIVADEEIAARAQLDEKGGIVTKRDVELVNASIIYGETKENE